MQVVGHTDSSPIQVVVLDRAGSYQVLWLNG